jgi:tRNA(fMet)-specific endonuclease VapC
MAFLLDTNAWIIYLKSASSKIRSRLELLSPREVFLCSVVKAELLHGAQKYGNAERRLKVLHDLFRSFCALQVSVLAFSNRFASVSHSHRYLE